MFHRLPWFVRLPLLIVYELVLIVAFLYTFVLVAPNLAREFLGVEASGTLAVFSHFYHSSGGRPLRTTVPFLLVCLILGMFYPLLRGIERWLERRIGRSDADRSSVSETFVLSESESEVDELATVSTTNPDEEPTPAPTSCGFETRAEVSPVQSVDATPRPSVSSLVDGQPVSDDDRIQSLEEQVSKLSESVHALSVVVFELEGGKIARTNRKDEA